MSSAHAFVEPFLHKVLGQEGKGTSQDVVHGFSHRRLAVVTARHEAMVDLGVVVALRGRMMTLEGFEPLTSGVVVSRIALK